MGGVMHAMLARLQAGRPVGVFPEGRTRDGSEVGPFHARIFQPAVEAGVPVQPVALRYGAHGSAQTVVAFGPKENFFANFVRLLGEPPRSADICFLDPIPAGELEGRSRIADLARDRIVAAMDSDA
jgi:1-acyl-sn-glycerol-3-phosphate acyltransferase